MRRLLSSYFGTSFSKIWQRVHVAALAAVICPHHHRPPQLSTAGVASCLGCAALLLLWPVRWQRQRQRQRQRRRRQWWWWGVLVVPAVVVVVVVVVVQQQQRQQQPLQEKQRHGHVDTGE